MGWERYNLFPASRLEQHWGLLRQAPNAACLTLPPPILFSGWSGLVTPMLLTNTTCTQAEVPGGRPRCRIGRACSAAPGGQGAACRHPSCHADLLVVVLDGEIDLIPLAHPVDLRQGVQWRDSVLFTAWHDAGGSWTQAECCCQWIERPPAQASHLARNKTPGGRWGWPWAASWAPRLSGCSRQREDKGIFLCSPSNTLWQGFPRRCVL